MKNKSAKNDLTAEEIVRFRKLEESFLKRCRHFGYHEIKTSTIEPLYIFTGLRALSDAKLRRMYSFIDWDGWSGERVALKPDSTPSIARFYGNHLYAKAPRQKLCYVENHFEWADSWDELSERWQCGVENFGSARAEADIEVIFMACDILKETGFEQQHLFLSYPAIVKAVVDALKLPLDAVRSLYEGIWKNDFEQIGKILQHVPEGDKVENLLTLQGRSAGYLCNLKTVFNDLQFENMHPALDNFIEICRHLDRLECPYVIDFSLLGDLQYYTGMQFQILSTPVRKSRKDILCAGGRYDSLVGDMLELADPDLPQVSEPIPAVGFSLYARNIVRHPDMVRRAAAAQDKRQNILIYISDITAKNVRTGQRLSDRLFNLGFSARITFTPVEQEKYDNYGLVIEVDHDRFHDGYQVLFSQKIGKPLLMNLFGAFNE